MSKIHLFVILNSHPEPYLFLTFVVLLKCQGEKLRFCLNDLCKNYNLAYRCPR